MSPAYAFSSPQPFGGLSLILYFLVLLADPGSAVGSTMGLELRLCGRHTMTAEIACLQAFTRQNDNQQLAALRL